MLSLDQTKNKLRNLIIQAPDQVFEVVKSHIPVAPKKMEMLILLQGRYQDLLHKVQKGVISEADQSLETNRIREQLLLWIDGLEEKDLAPDDVRSKKRKLYPLVILLSVLMMIALLWGALYLRPFESMGTNIPTDLDTAETTASQPIDLPAASVEKSQEAPNSALNNKPITKVAAKAAEDGPEALKAVHLKINVPSLWMDSEIMVDGKVVESLERVGTYITLALSPGSHKIQLTSGGDHCEKNILVEEGGGVVPFVCD